MNDEQTEIAITTIRPIIDKWIGDSENPTKSRKDWSNFKTRIRTDQLGRTALRNELLYMLADQCKGGHPVHAAGTAEDKYKQLRIDYKKLKDKLENKNEELRAKEVERKLDMTSVSKTEFENKILRQKLDNVIKLYKNQNKEEYIYKVINKNVSVFHQDEVDCSELESDYCPYQDEDQDPE